MEMKFKKELLLSLILIAGLNPILGQVWPGDVNNNGIVNGVDLLYLGSVYGLTGPARSEVDADWEEQPLITAWGSFFPNAVNHAFADCNGDGVVDENDIEEAIEDNFEETHLGSGQGDYTNGIPGMDIPLSLSPSLSIEDGDLNLKIALSLGNETFQVENFYGMALQLSYSSELMDEADFSFALTEDSWIDNVAGDNSYLLFQEDDDNQTAELAITLTDPNQSRSGQGRIGEFSIVMEDIIVGLLQDTIEIQIDSITLVSPTISKTAVVPDTLRLILSEDLLILSSDKGTQDKPSRVQVYPNPHRGRFLIQAEEPIENLRLFNILGQTLPVQVQRLGVGKYAISMPSATPGTYIISGRTLQASFTHKVMLTR